MKKRTKKTVNNLPYWVNCKEILTKLNVFLDNPDFLFSDLIASDFFKIIMNDDSKEFLKYIITINSHFDGIGNCNIMEYKIWRDPVTLEPMWNEMEGYRAFDLGQAYDYLNTRIHNEDLGDLSFPMLCEEIYFREYQIKLGLRNDYWGPLDQ